MKSYTSPFNTAYYPDPADVPFAGDQAVTAIMCEGWGDILYVANGNRTKEETKALADRLIGVLTLSHMQMPLRWNIDATAQPGPVSTRTSGWQSRPVLGPRACDGHEWQTDKTGLVDTCVKCGEQRA